MAETGKLTVYYDGSCPTCVKDRQRYEAMAGERGRNVEWFDITDQDEQLRAEGIDPRWALLELHVRDEQGRIHSEMDAYILLMSRVPRLRPLAWLLGLPLIRPGLAALSRWWVRRRLTRDGRLPQD